MPVNRNQFERYCIIHERIRSQTGPTWESLALACLGLPNNANKTVEQLRRTIFQDIENLKDAPFYAPIVSEKGRYYYNKEYSLNEVILPQETTLLKQIHDLLNYFAEMPFIEGFRELQLSVAERLNFNKPAIVSFDTNEHYVGLKHLPVVYEAIRSKKALNVHYKDFHQNHTQHTLSPYLLKEYKNRWFVFGWQHDKQQLYNLSLDRIEQVKDSAFGYIPNKADVVSHLRHTVGVTVYEQSSPVAVRIKVQKPRAYYLKTKPLHHTQQEESETEQYVIFSYTLHLNPELSNEVLGLGPDAVVLEPVHLREQIRGLIEEMRRLY